MNASNSVTEPRVRTVIRFSPVEVKAALKQYAERLGYVFDCDVDDLFVWPPREQQRETTLGLDKDGDKPGIVLARAKKVS